MLSLRVRQLSRVRYWPAQLVVGCGVGLLLGVVSLRFSPLWVLAGALAVLGLVAITYRPELGLLAIVLITVGLVDSTRLPLLGIGPISLHITDVLLLYLLALVLTRLLLVRGSEAVSTPLDVPVLWFCLASLFSATLAITQFSVNTHFVLRRLRPLMYYLSFFAVTNLIRDRRQLTTLVNGLLLIAVLACLAMLIQVLVPSLHLVQSRTGELVTAGREYAGVIRTYIEAERLIYSMVLLSASLLILQGRWLPPGLESARTAVLGTGLFLSFQRNYWLTMIAMLALLGALVPRVYRFRILRWGILAIVAVALLVSLPGEDLDRYLVAGWERLFWGMKTETLAYDTSTQMRVMEITHAVQSIAQHPLLGIGLGNLYRPAIAGDRYYNPEYPGFGLRWYIHNAYLWVWIDMGLMGLIPFIWLYAGCVVRGVKHWRGIRDPKLRPVVLGLTLAILGQGISNLVAPNFFQSWVLVVFAIFIGVNELILRWDAAEQPEA